MAETFPTNERQESLGGFVLDETLPDIFITPREVSPDLAPQVMTTQRSNSGANDSALVALSNHVFSITTNVFGEPVPPMSVDSRQLGRKLGKHVSDFGGDPSNESDRANVLERIRDIGDSPDFVFPGTFSGQGADGRRGAVDFRVKDIDVVVTRSDGSFVTILSNGIHNPSVRGAMKNVQRDSNDE